MLDQITIVGRVGIDPERSTTPWGDPQVSFRLASTRRRQNRETGAWEDAHTNWYRVRATKTLAEHAAEAVRRGQLVVVVGRLTIRKWERDDAKGTAVEIDADAIGIDLSRHRVSVDVGAPARVGVADADGSTVGDMVGGDTVAGHTVAGHASVGHAATGEPAAPRTITRTALLNDDAEPPF